MKLKTFLKAVNLNLYSHEVIKKLQTKPTGIHLANSIQEDAGSSDIRLVRVLILLNLFWWISPIVVSMKDVVYYCCKCYYCLPSLNFTRLLRVVITLLVIITRSNRMKFRLLSSCLLFTFGGGCRKEWEMAWAYHVMCSWKLSRIKTLYSTTVVVTLKGFNWYQNILDLISSSLGRGEIDTNECCRCKDKETTMYKTGFL